MNINDLTIGQAKELAAMFGSQQAEQKREIASFMIGKMVIIRTYSAGVWFGELAEKSGNEVILINARRMWRWFAAESVSISAVAMNGIDRSKSKIVEPVNSVWLEAIEIIPCTDAASDSIGGAEHVKAE